MSESKLKRRRHADILRRSRFCVYCGGGTAATTIDHMPPIGMFHGRRRPKGLEFPSCNACNQGTKTAELVAALVSRFFPDAINQEQASELRRLGAAVRVKIPGLMEEMWIGRGGQKFREKETGITGGHFVRANGPLVSKYMQTFAIKLGFALHYHFTGMIVPAQGGVAARWFTNVDRATDRFPQSIFRLLPPAETLKQGKVEVASQFQYSATYSEDGSIGLYLGTFRRSFAVVAFGATDQRLLTEAGPDAEGFRVYRPGEILIH
jgi:hypothetical protein